MKSNIYLVVFIIFYINCFGQKCDNSCNLNNTLNITTGLDDLGNVLAYGQVDPNWILVNNPPLRLPCNNTTLNSILPPNAYTMNYANNSIPIWTAGPNQWANQNGSVTIAPGNINGLSGSNASQGSFNCNNSVRYQPFIFEYRFCVCSDDEEIVDINLTTKADDIGAIELIENATGSVKAQIGSIGQPSLTNWNTSVNLSQGTYTLRYYLTNTGATTTGFSVIGSISSSNSIFMKSNPVCCQNYSVTIQKVFDLNCNGVYDNDDQSGNAGWDFDIYDISTSSVIRSGTTNVFGEIVVSSLPAGTYQVIERPNATYPNSTPFQNNITFTVNNSNPHEVIYFYNCITKMTINKVLDKNCNGRIDDGESWGGSGWSFELYQGSTLINTYTTNSTGRITIWDLPVGNYSLLELPNSGSPYNFPLNNNQNFSISNTSVTNLTFYNCQTKISIKKILDNDCDGTESNGDQSGGAGWDFEVYDGATQVGSCTTNASGECTVVGLPLGNYTVVELPNSSSSYNHPVNNNINVSLSNSNIQDTVYFFNCQPQIQVRKILDNDCDGTYSSGDQIGGANWTFDLKDTSGTVIVTSTTNATGIATFTGVPFGNYTVFERPRAGSAYPTPFQNNIAVNFTVANHIETLDFFNCPVIQASPSPCCEVELAIWNPDDGNQHPSPIQPTTVSGVDLSYSEETFEIHQDATIPITELRVSVTDIHFEYNYDQCAECVNNPALWGSIYGTDSTIGNSPSQLTLNTSSSLNNIVDNGINTREIIWDNPNGAMLKSGDTFKVGYILPSLSEIPCCVSKVRICIKISWKDAECRLCERYTCSDIDLEEKITSLNILSKKKGCCERVLTVDSDTSASYEWNTGATTESITVTQNGSYTVTATSGSSSLSKTIIVGDIPTGNFPVLDHSSRFDPSGTTANMHDKFYIFDSQKPLNANNAYNASKYKLWIFNRWGELIREFDEENCDGFKNYSIHWDGKDEFGNLVPTGTYEWRFFAQNCKFKNDTQVKFRTGFEKCGCKRRILGICVNWNYCPKEEKVVVGHVNVLR